MYEYIVKKLCFSTNIINKTKAVHITCFVYQYSLTWIPFTESYFLLFICCFLL